MTIEFQAWPKTPRLFRDIVITEKIDGSNSAIIIQEIDPHEATNPDALAIVKIDDDYYEVGAQSRKKLITPGKTTDNYNFAQWVQGNAELLVEQLGPGRHFGEWWGKGIQKRYGDLDYRVFSLFNVGRYGDTFFRTEDLNGTPVNVESVPVLYEGPFSEEVIHLVAKELLKNGSLAAPFAPNPEGLMIYHTQSRKAYKFTFDNNDKGKWEYNDVTEVE